MMRLDEWAVQAKPGDVCLDESGHDRIAIIRWLDGYGATWACINFTTGATFMVPNESLLDARYFEPDTLVSPAEFVVQETP